MWCDNCCLLFPLRAGAMALGVIMALYQIGAGIFLFQLGEFFFTLFKEATIYGGYAMGQGALALLAVIALSSRSYVFSRFIFLLYPVIIVLGAVRAGVMVWSLNKYSDRIIWSCNNGGVSWVQAHEEYNGFKPPPALYDSPKLPNQFCTAGVKQISNVFALFLVVDFVLMLYFYFLIWRFNVRLQHYPVQKNDLVYP
ncbi:unnamed protein product [Rhizophagus irregularis]|uniref:Uncharacterized protein n=1 Tax=Rhizophagus irregularis TaxID=588596 RepID=A0A2N1N987_9GLOM|nr:hypothetical protein RhiirC2_466569 [Rhizophagus irregularis]CAB4396843.1 unnamed protein product [Rhizophagus irregularis]CAB5371024.1 unnamed protein product [Rhizophagus irregularis]